MTSNNIQFVRTKDFKLIKEIGQGGLGKTVLLRDEIINEDFICKKYSPIFSGIAETYFDNFVEEIKLLHLLNHRNIVRVFNYYLYPEQKTGYILMEYVKGKEIHDYVKNNPQNLNEIFTQTIEGFKYLEQINVLHRDIRPQNILVSDDGIVKIIDFGFGKKIEFNEHFDKSISLNWRFSPPSEFANKIYDFKTELYFVGKLFEELIMENQIENFAFPEVLNKMITINYNDRIDSFFEISRSLLNLHSNTLQFTVI
jgi:eukaryotic-like serine/threonine-protein kinase